MTRLAFILIISFASINSNAQNIIGNTYTDTLTYLLNAGNNNFDDLYDGVIPVNKYGQMYGYEPNFIKVYSYLGSSYAYLVSVSHGDFPDYAKSQLRINYCESSNYKKGVKTDKIKKEIKNLFENLAKLPEYKITKDKKYSNFKKDVFIYKNNILLASYHDKVKKNEAGVNSEGDFCVIFYEQPRTKILADEATYNNVFPSTIKATTLPQIWEQKQQDINKGRINRMNGVFTSSGVLKVGTKTYHGYSDFYDGTWYSDNWEYCNVRFTPEGTNDIICGNYFSTEKFQDFVVKDHYVDKFKDATDDNPYYELPKYSFSTDYNCKWIKQTYPSFSIIRDKEHDIASLKRKAENDAANEKYNKEHPGAKQETNITKKGILTFCRYCNGSGQVVDRVVTGSQYETTHYKTCTKCGGAGSWME